MFLQAKNVLNSWQQMKETGRNEMLIEGWEQEEQKLKADERAAKQDAQKAQEKVASKARKAAEKKESLLVRKEH